MTALLNRTGEILNVDFAINFVRAALVLIFLGFGYVKFFPFEANGVEPLIMAHPLLSWLLPVFGKSGAAAFLGISELSTGLLLLVGFRSPLSALLGGLMSLVTFFITVTLFVFLPGVWEASAGGFPAISGTGAFLLKDAALFAGGLLIVTDALSRLGPQAGVRLASRPK